MRFVEIARRRFAGTGLHDRRMTSPPSPVRLFCYHIRNPVFTGSPAWLAGRICASGNCPAALRWHGPTRSAHDIHALAGQAIPLPHPQPPCLLVGLPGVLTAYALREIARRRFAGTAYTIGA